ncbi:MAG: hypothetical protein AAF701_04465, partial [Pseudomonadota bacterium]
MMNLDDLKQICHSHLLALLDGADPAAYVAGDAALHMAHPLNEGTGPAHMAQAFHAVRASFTGLERRDQIFVAGDNIDDSRHAGPRPAQVVAAMGVYQGTFA